MNQDALSFLVSSTVMSGLSRYRMAKVELSQTGRDTLVMLSHQALESAQSLMEGLRPTHQRHRRLTEKIRELKSALDSIYLMPLLRLGLV